MHSGQTFAIEPPKNGKGRSFSVLSFGYALANQLWAPLSIAPEAGVHRPIFISFAATDAELQAFVANLKKGRAFQAKSRWGHRERKMEMPSSAGYKWTTQKLGGGSSIVTALIPRFFELDPGGVDPDRVGFVFAPTSWRVAEQRQRNPDLEEDQILGAMLAGMLDRRATVPIISEPGFWAQLIRSARKQPWYHATSGSGYQAGPLYVWPETSPTPPGFAEFAMVLAPPAQLAAFIAAETQLYARRAPSWLKALDVEPFDDSEPASMQPEKKKEGDGSGETRKHRGGRVLPNSRKSFEQLVLPF